MTGLCCGRMRMPVASLMRSVAAATYAIQISGSGSGKSFAPPAILPSGQYG